jgi:mono/diheme cytochrome c family protein
LVQRRFPRHFSRLIVSAALLCGAFPLDCAHADDVVARGIYLARAGNCISCHTKIDGEPYAGGVSFPTAFGVIYSTNITSDKKTGIGAWTLAQFTAALRLGLGPDGRHLYPVFPYTAFTKLSDPDVAALFAYFQTVAPVAATPPKNAMHFPFDQRWLMGAWNTLFFDEGRFRDDASRSPQWNRGAYLVEALGHCGACHSPRNRLGGETSSALAFSGGAYFDEDEDGRLVAQAPVNLTPAAGGLGAWTEKDISDYLKTGASSRTRVMGAMNAVILNSTRHLTDEDDAAIAAYLKALPAIAPASPAEPDARTLQAGALQFDIHCGTCHLPTGLGSANTAPPLVGSAIAQTANPASFINLVLYGPQHPVEKPSPQWRAKGWREMPAFDQQLTDEDAAALMTYVRNAWGNSAPPVTARDVEAQR